MSVNNHEFAREVGCDHTMASRLRNGKRRPSTNMLMRICEAYKLDEGTALRKLNIGTKAFSEWLREQVFEKEDEDRAA